MGQENVPLIESDLISEIKMCTILMFGIVQAFQLEGCLYFKRFCCTYVSVHKYTTTNTVDIGHVFVYMYIVCSTSLLNSMEPQNIFHINKNFILIGGLMHTYVFDYD